MGEFEQSVSGLLTLSCFGKIGPVGYEKLCVHKKDVLKLKLRDFVRVGIRGDIAEEFIAFRNGFDLDCELGKLEEIGVRLLSRDDPEYPPLLLEVTDPPYLLYVRGDVSGLHQSTLAVVGSRVSSHYGMQVIERIIPAMCGNSITIISGLAVGIDAQAHAMAIASKGCTVAVVGCGLDVPYPSDNVRLAERIVNSGGGIISEYPLGTAPLKAHFPARNRIISGISRGTMVVECNLKSGAMITAKCALEQNREVFAAPGSILSRYSAGPNSLIRMGAHAVTKPEDILEEFHIHPSPSISPAKPARQPLAPDEKVLFDLLSFDPMHVDALIEQSGLSASDTGSALLFLEMKGMVRNVGAATYIRR